MPSINYRQLQESLEIEIGANWLEWDTKDDFFPDPINYADIIENSRQYLDSRKHRLLQIDTLPHWFEYLPKKSKMLREGIFLHPTHRILYLAILRHFLHKIDIKLNPSVYSYRPRDPNNMDEYPFGNSIDRWKLFINNFRKEALQPETGAVLVTDLSSYFDHIHCEKLCHSLESLLGPAIDDADRAVLDLLQNLLRMWSTDYFGLPQNYDTSSFLGSLYLHSIDTEISAKYKLFRYVDDFRIVVSSYEEALTALHDLQKALSGRRLFLATDKTAIILKDSPQFSALMDVTDDVLLSKAEEVIASGDCTEIIKISEELFDRLEFHSTEAGEDRKFRAYSNRLLSASKFEEIRDDIYPRLISFVSPRLESFPERSDYWVKILSAYPVEAARDLAIKYLIKEKSPFAWQRFHLWNLVLHMQGPIPEQLLNAAKATASEPLSSSTAAKAIMCIGKHGDNTMRESLFRHFSAQANYTVRRAILIALQELPDELRNKYYKRANHLNSDHEELICWCNEEKEIKYGEIIRGTSNCKDVPNEVEVEFDDGIGLIDGEVIKFRLMKDDFGYE